MLWYGNDQNMVGFQMRYTNFLVLGMKILLSGNTFCVKWWICSCDLCKWLSGGFVAHPILAVKYSFVVTCDILDEFSWLANVLHNCQNFAVLFLRNIEKEEVSPACKFFCYSHSVFSVLFYLPCLVAFCKPLHLLWLTPRFMLLCLFIEQLCYSWLGCSNTLNQEYSSCM